MKNLKKLITLLLCAAMIVGVTPAMARAEEPPVDTSTAVARVNDDVEYGSLAEAVENANAGDTITLLVDVSLSATQEINKNLTLDLGSNTITSTVDSFGLRITSGSVEVKNGTISSSKYGITTTPDTAPTLTLTDLNITAELRAVQNNGGIVNISGGTYVSQGEMTLFNNKEMHIIGGNFSTNSTKDGDAVLYCTAAGTNTYISGGTISNLNGYGVASMDGANVTVSGTADISAKVAALGGNNTEATENFTVTGGTLTASDGPAIFFPSEGILNISSGTITGKTGIHSLMGTISITGGTITGTATENGPDMDNYPATGSGPRYDGSALLLVKNNYDKCQNSNALTVKISDDAILKGGTAAINILDAGKYEQTFSMSISGGTFSSKPASEYITSGYEVRDNGDNTFTVYYPSVYVPVGPTPDVPKTEVDTKPDGSSVTTTTQKDTITGVETKTDVIKDKDGTTTANAEVNAPARVNTTGNTAKAEITSQAADKLVEQAKKAEKEAADAGAKEVKTTITITASLPAGTTQVETSLPAETVKTIAEETSADLKVTTTAGDITLDNEALKAVAGQAEGETVKLTIEQMKSDALPEAVRSRITENTLVLDLNLETGKGKVSDFGGGTATVATPIPEGLDPKDVKVMFINDKGEAEEVKGTIIEIDGKSYYQFTTGHFSYYALSDSKTVDSAVADTKAKLTAAVKASKIKVSAKSGKGYIKLSWKPGKGTDVDYYEVFRSTKKSSGYGKKAFHTTANESKTTYKNSKKQLKNGKKYYYKVRGVKLIDGKKVYTKWSNVVSKTYKK
ncbi:hypothetical protein [Anaerolentibacter hominis]|uniref:hypothetical protein n=1 Tax=Anaerolentibacter hominis TaxID=3079009 RepID=UPI0031B81CC4